MEPRLEKATPDSVLEAADLPAAEVPTAGGGVDSSDVVSPVISQVPETTVPTTPSYGEKGPDQTKKDEDVPDPLVAQAQKQLEEEIAQIDALIDEKIEEALKKFDEKNLPARRADGESIQEFDTRLQSWVASFIDKEEVQKQAKVVAAGLIEGASKRDEAWEKHTMQVQKQRRLALAEKEKKDAEVLQNEALRNFDLTSLLVRHQKESTNFYHGITRLLYDLKAMVESPVVQVTEFGNKIEQIVTDIGNITTSCSSMVTRSSTAIEQVNLQLKDLSWHLGPKSVDRRCLPERDKNSRTIWKESTREIMITSRYKLKDICDQVEKLTEMMGHQLNVSGTMNGFLEQSLQVQLETRDLMKALLESQKKEDVEAKRAAEEKSKLHAQATLKRKQEAEEARRVADEALKRAKLLQESVDTDSAAGGTAPPPPPKMHLGPLGTPVTPPFPPVPMMHAPPMAPPHPVLLVEEILVLLLEEILVLHLEEILVLHPEEILVHPLEWIRTLGVCRVFLWVHLQDRRWTPPIMKGVQSEFSSIRWQDAGSSFVTCERQIQVKHVCTCDPWLLIEPTLVFECDSRFKLEVLRTHDKRETVTTRKMKAACMLDFLDLSGV